MTAAPTGRFATPSPVAYLAECAFGGCKDPVQFLSANAHYLVPLCREHGIAEIEAEMGNAVVFAGPLGYISADDPEPAA